MSFEIKPAKTPYNNGVPRRSKHGEARRGQHAPEWDRWMAMIARCGNPKAANYGRYGGRGIKVCDRWLNSYDNFLADMGRMPSADYSIDRIDNNGDYEPSNCRWATRSEQQSNRRGINLIEYQGRKMTGTAWARTLGISAKTLLHRIQIGWPIEDALTLPATHTNKKHFRN